MVHISSSSVFSLEIMHENSSLTTKGQKKIVTSLIDQLKKVLLNIIFWVSNALPTDPYQSPNFFAEQKVREAILFFNYILLFNFL